MSEATDKPRLMALVFALRLQVLGVAVLFVSLALFAWPLSSSREWEALFVLFAIFMICVATVLSFIRFAGHANRLLLLTPVLALLPVGARGNLVLGVFSTVLVLEAFRRESGGLWWFPAAQLVTALGASVLALLQGGWVWLVSFWGSLLLVPVFFSMGCWQWQKQIKHRLTEFDRDDS